MRTALVDLGSLPLIKSTIDNLTYSFIRCGKNWGPFSQLHVPSKMIFWHWNIQVSPRLKSSMTDALLETVNKKYSANKRYPDSNKEINF